MQWGGKHVCSRPPTVYSTFEGEVGLEDVNLTTHSPSLNTDCFLFPSNLFLIAVQV